MKKTLCFFQVVKPRPRFNKEGVGDCLICTPHSDNAKCANFLGLTLYSFEAVEKVEAESEEIAV